MRTPLSIIGLVCFLAPIARAGDTLFPKGTQEAAFSLGYAFPLTNDEADYYTLTGEYGYYLVDNIAIVPTLRGHHVDARSQTNIYGVDFDLAFRWHALNFGKWSIYGMVVPGVSYFDHRLPFQTDTHFNWTIGGGPGATYQLADHLFLTGGFNYMHFSNADIEGVPRHHASNAGLCYLGLMWTF